MAHALCMPEATNTHSEYVMLIAVARQQWLHDRASMLGYTHTACLLYVTLVAYCNIFFYHGGTALSGPGPRHFRGFVITLKHTTLGRTPVDE